jgi:hypothetical protein
MSDMNDKAKLAITSHILIRDKKTGQEIVNKRLIPPSVKNKKEVINDAKHSYK